VPVLHSKHGKGWDCGLEQSREELGWGYESETSPFGSSEQLDVTSWLLNAASVSYSSVGLFLLCHVNPRRRHPVSQLDQLAVLAPNSSCCHISLSVEELQPDKQGHPAPATNLVQRQLR